jgi:hypothetical protein
MSRNCNCASVTVSQLSVYLFLATLKLPRYSNRRGCLTRQRIWWQGEPLTIFPHK